MKEPMVLPVADLDGQSKPGQGADPSQAAQPVHDRVNSQSAAIWVIAASSRSRRSFTVSTAS